MTDIDDRVARGATVRRLGSRFRWPGGRHVAVVINVAYEAWSDGVAPGVGPMGNPLPPRTFDSNAMSWGHYGATRGIQRLLDILRRTDTRASIMVSGILATRTPDVIAAMADAGHEIVAHSLAQDVVPAGLSAEQDVENIRQTTSLLAGASGVQPTGWISPRGTPGADTARLLLEAGYVWHGDVFDDDRPYLQLFEQGHLVAIPLTMEINDLPHAMRFGRSPRQFIEAFDDQLAHALSHEREAMIIDVTAHAHVYGRPSGAWAFEEIITKVRERDDVWVATRAELARHVIASEGLFPGGAS
jgi:peptidoglycan/xylan/chitin deacetylase (PgdA/CDA1 family)